MQCLTIPLTKAQHWVCGWFGVTIPPSATKWHVGATNRQRVGIQLFNALMSRPFVIICLWRPVLGCHKIQT